MKRLIEELLEKDLSEKEIIEVCKAVNEYRQAQRQFHESQTPEGEALARWNMQIAKENWSDTTMKYGLKGYKVEQLIK